MFSFLKSCTNASIHKTKQTHVTKKKCYNSFIKKKLGHRRWEHSPLTIDYQTPTLFPFDLVSYYVLFFLLSKLGGFWSKPQNMYVNINLLYKNLTILLEIIIFSSS